MSETTNTEPLAAALKMLPADRSRAFDLEAARTELFAGIVDDEGLMELFDFSKRTLERKIADGMPFLKWGDLRLSLS